MKNLYRFKIAIYVLIFCINCIYQPLHSQNLVNNWSFEDTVACPSGLSQINNSVGWYSIRSSPDYFNSCNQGIGSIPTNVNVPQNVIDFQNARTGNSYSGFATLHILTNYKEFIGTQLNQVLQIGQKYYVKFYVSKAVNHSVNFNMDISIDKIGVHFYTSPYAIFNPAPTDNFAQVFSSSIISDTLNWIEIKGSFVADSNYQYVGFGNFFDLNHTNYIQNDTNRTISYYFIDDICISPDSTYCEQLTGINNLGTNSTIQIFPNPARDWIVIGVNEIKSLKFYDVSGRLKVSYSQIIAPFKVDLSNIASGFYVVEIETKNGIYFQKIILTH